MKVQKLSAKTLTRWAATVLISQLTHKPGVANCASSKPSMSVAIWRRCSATAAKTNSRSTRTSAYSRLGPRPGAARFPSRLLLIVGTVSGLGLIHSSARLTKYLSTIIRGRGCLP